MKQDRNEENIPRHICALAFFANREAHVDAMRVKETHRVEAEAIFWLAAKCVILYAAGMPSKKKSLGSLAEVARKNVFH